MTIFIIDLHDFVQPHGRPQKNLHISCNLNKLWWCSPKYANLDKAKIDVKEGEIESFQMINHFFGEAASFTESPPDTMPQLAVIAFYANGIFLSDKMVFYP